VLAADLGEGPLHQRVHRPLVVRPAQVVHLDAGRPDRLGDGASSSRRMRQKRRSAVQPRRANSSPSGGSAVGE
jgi:hypothetical protein